MTTSLFSRGLGVLAAALLFGTALSADAATLTTGTLIKGPGDTVYYYANNGKRLVFPTDKTYKTWYPDFSGVVTISASELAEIPLGGNVTYRPGVKLVKVTTDPKVYAVSSHGALRWVTTEAVASTLYGADWNKKIDDVPDAYFTNYTVGSPIQNASDYSPAQQTAAAVDINTDRQINGAPAPLPSPTPTPTPTSTPSVATSSTLAFIVSKVTAQAGDTETLTASVTDNTAILKLELFFDGILIKSCTSPSCSGDTRIPQSGTKSSYVAEARLTTLSNQILTKTITIPVQTDGSNLVQIHVGQAMIMPNQAGSIIVDIDASIAILRVDISLDGNIVGSCINGARQCRWSGLVSETIGSVHPAYAKVTDTLGRTYTSKTLTITISNNDSPSVTVTPAKAMIYSGENVDVTVTASDNDGIVSIDVMKDGVVLKHCEGATPCTASTGPWTGAGTTLIFTGRATDTRQSIGTAEPQTVSIVTAN